MKRTTMEPEPIGRSAYSAFAVQVGRYSHLVGAPEPDERYHAAADAETIASARAVLIAAALSTRLALRLVICSPRRS
jgi:hypothetical protein